MRVFTKGLVGALVSGDFLVHTVDEVENIDGVQIRHVVLAAQQKPHDLVVERAHGFGLGALLNAGLQIPSRCDALDSRAR